MTGRIFDIQRFSLHDGPGIRTTVFFKGCNLLCRWCHNPESASPAPELQYYRAKCIRCGRCLNRCPNGCLSMGPDGIVADRQQCAGCGECARECYAGALVPVGSEVTGGQVMETVLRDRAFYESSGGGATFSGGEPMLQPEFLLELLGQCRAQCIDAAIETAGNVPWERFAAVMPLAGLFLYDVKHVDDSAHALGTGAGCARILKNLELLLDGGARVWVRIPVIPGFNAGGQAMGAIAARLAGLQGLEKIELMPYHRLGLGKYESLGRMCSTAELAPPVLGELAAIADLFAAHGLMVHWAQNP